MVVTRMLSRSWRQSGSFQHTVDIAFPPSSVFVTAGLSSTTGAGLQLAGIVATRTRGFLDTHSTHESFASDGYLTWRSSLYRDRMTRVTCGGVTANNQRATVLFTLYFFD